MPKFKINIRLNRKQIEKKFNQKIPTLSVNGLLSINLNGKFYPDKLWDDFNIVVITWWLKDLNILLEEGYVRNYFMDGSYRIDLKLIKKQQILLLSFLDEGSNEIYIRDFTIILSDYINELLRVANEIQKKLIQIIPNILSIKCNDYELFINNLSIAKKSWKEYKQISFN